MQKPGLFGMNGFLLFLLTCCSYGLQAQQAGNLIIVDADNKLPFTVHVGDQLFASSSHGHLVIAHLKDSTYKIGVRFPRKTLPEQVFPIQVKQKDLGFLLQGSDSVWVLYNWQNKTTIRPVKDHDSSRILEMGVKREDGFSKLMAAVVDDTAVMYNTYTGSWFTGDSLSQLPVTATSAVQPASQGIPSSQQLNKLRDSSVAKIVQPVANQPTPTAAPNGDQVTKQPVAVTKQGSKPQDTALAKNDKPLITNAKLAMPVAKNPQPAKPTIKKIREVNLKISRKMVFLDTGPEGNVDTVTLFVFYENKDSIKKQAADAVVAKKKQAGADTSAAADIQSKTAGAEVFIRGCGEQATTADVEWLRSAILKANSEQDKIGAASAAFALKCFSVNQLRVLAALLVSDKARYKLMEAAKLHISDKDHFRELADMYTDKNFQKKFLVMADKRS